MARASKKGLETEQIPSENRPEDSRFNKLDNNELLIKPPFTMVITGSIGSGKSSIVWSMLNPYRGFYKKYFDYILIFNGSVDSNDTWAEASTEENEIHISNKWDNDKFKDFTRKLERDQMRLKEEGKQMQRVCVVFDDAVTQGISNRGKINALDDLIQRCRHLNCSVIIASQVYRQLNRSMRALNTLAFIITKVNLPDLRAIAEEHCGLISQDEFIEMYKKVMKMQGHPFLLINYQRSYDKRFWATFNNLITFSKDEIEKDKKDELFTSEEDGDPENDRKE